MGSKRKYEESCVLLAPSGILLVQLMDTLPRSASAAAVAVAV